MTTAQDAIGNSDYEAYTAHCAAHHGPLGGRLAAWWHWRQLERRARAMDAGHPVAVLVLTGDRAELAALCREVWPDD